LRRLLSEISVKNLYATREAGTIMTGERHDPMLLRHPTPIAFDDSRMLVGAPAKVRAD
jgi:hypothetical protein